MCLNKNKPSEILRKIKTQQREKYNTEEKSGDISDMYYKGPFSDSFIKFAEKDGRNFINSLKKISKW